MKINIEKIQKSLDELDRRFSDEVDKPDVDDFQLSIYCKVAALELCGWLEETHDELIKSALKKKGVNDSDVSDFNEMFIKKVNGLSYKEHLRPLMINAFGFVEITKLEIEIIQMEGLKSILQELHKYRNYLAHTQYIHFQGRSPVNSQKSIDTPSTIKDIFKKIHPILQEVANYFHR